jgi:hypothetical protein
MNYCTRCGKQNPDSNKFCIGCGTLLKANPLNTDYSTELFAKTATTKKGPWLILGVIGLLGLATGGYFIISSKKGTPKDAVSDNKTVTKDTVSSPPTVKQKPSDPVPLIKDQVEEQKVEITAYETDRVTNTVESFYDAEDREDITTLLGYYSFPLDRYYQLYNVGYDQLHKMVTDAYNGKLYYHKIDIKWNYSTVQKLPSGDYKVLLYADYTSASENEADRKTRNIHLTIILDSNYQITSIYPS